MLVLTRKNLEAVVVGGSGDFQRLIKVTVLEIGGTKVKLGFEVDDDIPVYRFEVYERINAERPSGASQPVVFDCGLRDAPQAERGVQV